MDKESELVFIKLGGSVITDKRKAGRYHQKRTQRLAKEIYKSWISRPNLRLLIGHGSGSFGHVAASEYGTINGVSTLEQWVGFGEVANAAAELNHLVAKDLREAGLPVWRIQPSASAMCRNGQLIGMALHPIRSALDNRLVPLIYGDVALDTERGGTIISTEAILGYLTDQFPVTRIILVGEVAGVFDERGEVIPKITPGNIRNFGHAFQGSGGTDVTGGMLDKVEGMVKLVSRSSGLTIRIIDGRQSDLLYQVLVNDLRTGTLIRSD